MQALCPSQRPANPKPGVVLFVGLKVAAHVDPRTNWQGYENCWFAANACRMAHRALGSRVACARARADRVRRNKHCDTDTRVRCCGAFPCQARR